MPVFDVESLADPRLEPFRNLPDRELRAAGELFLVEARLGVRRLLTESSYAPHSFFVTPAALRGLADVLGKLPAETPIYVGSQALLNEVVGYNLHRGCLAAVWRGAPREPARVLERCVRQGRALLVLEELNNPENIGNVFRNAVAFGAGGVWLSAGCADPLYRQATRISMGGTLRVPFARLAPRFDVCAALRAQGCVSVALTPDATAPVIEGVARKLAGAPHVALLFGNEADGLSPGLMAQCDFRARIGLMPEVDSLNVATASGIALHHFAGLGQRMKAVVVKTGSTLPELRERRGDYEDWIAAGLGVALGDLAVVRVYEGDELPKLAGVPAVIVTGSSAYVSEREAWSERAAEWLADAVAAGTPVLGICYGHQLLAHALGGRVERNPRGRQMGTVEVTLLPDAAGDPLLGGFANPLTAQATHLESVTKLPPEARRLGENALDPHHAFAVGTSAWGVQFHPEFDADVMRAYLAARREILRAEGIDPEPLERGVTESPGGPKLLRRFADFAGLRV